MLDPLLEVVEACECSSIGRESSDYRWGKATEKVANPLLTISVRYNFTNGWRNILCTCLDLCFNNVDRVTHKPAERASQASGY